MGEERHSGPKGWTQGTHLLRSIRNTVVLPTLGRTWKWYVWFLSFVLKNLGLLWRWVRCRVVGDGSQLLQKIALARHRQPKVGPPWFSLSPGFMDVNMTLTVLLSSSSFLSVAVITTLTKGTWRGKGLSLSHFHVRPSWREPAQELRQDQRPHRNASPWLPRWLAQLALLLQLKTTCQGWHLL